MLAATITILHLQLAFYPPPALLQCPLSKPWCRFALGILFSLLSILRNKFDPLTSTLCEYKTEYYLSQVFAFRSSLQ